MKRTAEHLKSYMRAAAWARRWKSAAREYRRGFDFWGKKIGQVWMCLDTVNAPDRHPDGDASTVGRIRGLAWQRDQAVHLVTYLLELCDGHLKGCGVYWDDGECTCGISEVENDLKELLRNQ